MRKEIVNPITIGLTVFYGACSNLQRVEPTITPNPIPTHEPTPTFEPTPALPANLEGAKQWREGCILSPVIDSSYIGIRFSADHQGVDFGERFINYPTKASISGTVVYSDYETEYGYGNLVIIETPIEGRLFIQTRFAHLERPLVLKGEEVRQGQRIGIVGSTGYSSGPHLHFETLITNWPFDELVFYSHRVLSVPETTGRLEEFESLYGQEQIEWIDPLGLIKETCQ